MASINVPQFGERLTVNVTAGGVVTVADTTKYFVGCDAWLSRTSVGSVRVKIMKILSSTTMAVQALLDQGANASSLSYGYSDLHSYTAAQTTADKAFATVGAGHFDTKIQAVTTGANGNSISIALVGDSAGAVSITRVGLAFTIHFNPGTSTVGNVETAIAALAGGDALISVETSGTLATVLASGDAFGPTFLTGGSTTRFDMPTQTARINRSFNARTTP